MSRYVTASVSRPERYHGKPTLGRVRNRMGHDKYVSPIPVSKLRRVLPGIVLWPVPLDPEVRQHIH